MPRRPALHITPTHLLGWKGTKKKRGRTTGGRGRRRGTMSPGGFRAQTGVKWILVCLVLLPGMASCRPVLRHYYFVNQPMAWARAKAHCSANNSILATMGSEEDVQQLLLAAAGAAGVRGSAWFGLYDPFWSWRWTLTNQRLMVGVNNAYKGWNVGQPSNPRTEDELCGAVKQHRLHDVPCRQEFPFLCYSDENITGVSNISLERYFYFDRPKTWHDARAHCQENYTDLAAARDDAELAAIAQLVAFDAVVAVGAHRTVWSWWADGVQRRFKNWLPGHPTPRGGNCATLLVGGDAPGKWAERHCNENLPFFCMKVELRKRQTLHIRLAGVASTADLNDPAVTDAVLKLVGKKLTAGGIKSSFKMSWKKRRRQTVFTKEEEETPRSKETCP